MRWEAEPNAFLAWLSVVNGRTSSVKTWRSYAYHFADWLSFCERIGVPWRHVTELNIATYRNILATEASPHTGRVLRRGTINYKLGVICQFYRFAHRKGWLDALPFERRRLEFLTMPTENLDGLGRAGFVPVVGNSLRLTEGREELEVPPRHEVRRFIKSFRNWRDQLLARSCG